MPASKKGEEAELQSGTLEDEVEIVDDDDNGVVEVEDGTPVQGRAATSDTDDGEQPDDDDDSGSDTEQDRAKLEQKRKKAAQRENAKLKRELEAHRKELDALRQSVGSIREAEVARARDGVRESLSAAEQALEAAYEDGDAKGIVAAQRALAKAEAEAAQWERAPKEPPRSQPASAPSSNPLAEAFIDKHSEWFDPQGGDADSEIVRTLSDAIAREGVSPSSKAHFDELEKRMQRYLPHRVEKPRAKPRGSAAAPSTRSSSSGDSMSGKIPIPRQTIVAFRDNLGVDWDDPDPENRAEARKRITARVKESRTNRAGDTA
jgi:hypothetical protein